MLLEPLIISVALSRASNAVVALAAYDIMFGIALVVEAPVLMLISTSTSLSRTRQAFWQLFKLTLALGGAAVAVGFLVSLTPLYGWLVLGVMGIPPAVAEAARPGLIILSLWPFPVAWRRTLQGVLIAHDRTPLVTMATILRLAAISCALAIGSRLMPEQMLVVSAFAMLASVVVEALAVTPPAFSIVFQLPAAGEEPPLTWQRLLGFYQPLATMMVLRQVGRPLLSAGVAAAQHPVRSLAAWSVAWRLLLLPFGAAMGLEQVVIAKASAAAPVRRFIWGIGLLLVGVLALLAFTPLVHPVLAVLFDLSSDIEPLVILGLRLTVALPLLQSLQGLLRGTAIYQGRTRDVRSAVIASLAAVALVTTAGRYLDSWTGVVIGAVATMLSALAEVSWLAWRQRSRP